jgi:hypothetical protein
MSTFEHPWSDLDEAKYRLVHDYHPGGARGLGPLVRMNPGTLCNKVHPGMENHHLTVDEAVNIQAVLRRYDVLHAEARALGHVCVQLEDHSEASDMELLDAYAAYHADVGETAQAIRDALAHGDGITREAVARVERELFEDARAGFEFLARLKALAED